MTIQGQFRLFQTYRKLDIAKIAQNMAISWPNYGPRNINDITQLLGPFQHLSINLNQTNKIEAKNKVEIAK